MNREEYLLSLYDALDGIDSQEKEDIIGEYKEFFGIEEENGRKAEDIIASLGDPTILANTIIRTRANSWNSYPHTPLKPKRPNLLRKLSIFVTIIVIASVIIGFSFSKIVVKDGWDNIGFIGKKYTVDETNHIALNSAIRIEINTTNTDVTLSTVSSNNLEAHLKGSVRTMSPNSVPSLTLTKSGDSIIITEKYEKNKVGFHLGNLQMNINIPADFTGDIVYNGQSGDFKTSDLYLKSFDISLLSGDIKMSDINVNDGFFISTTSGNIEIDGLMASRASFETISGDKEFRNINVTNEVTIDSSSGDISVEQVNTNQMNIDSKSGDIKVDDCTIDLLSVESLSGGVGVERFEGSSNLNVVSGNIKFQSHALKEKINLKTASGNITLKLPDHNGFNLNARSEHGDIDCDFNLDNKDSDKKSLTGIFGDGTTDITLKTTSGNIKINKH